MTSDRSKDALLKFLEYVEKKGLAPSNTIAARRAAVGKVLGILEEDEKADILVLDLPGVMTRFNNLHGQDYTPGSLTTYQSRVKAALDDFKSYLSNPLSFKPGGQTREKSIKTSVQNRPLSSIKAQEASPPAASHHPAPMSDTILPIRLRLDLTVYIQGLPFDLTKAEAAKISAVVNALASADA